MMNAQNLVPHAAPGSSTDSATANGRKNSKESKDAISRSEDESDTPFTDRANASLRLLDIKSRTQKGGHKDVPQDPDIGITSVMYAPGVIDALRGLFQYLDRLDQESTAATKRAA